MSGENTNVLIDLVVLVSLLISIGYMFFLMRAIKKIHDSRVEFRQVLKELNQTIGRAEMAVDGLRNTADATGKKLQKEIDTATSLVNELQFINQAGDNVARRLEKLTSTEAGSKVARTPDNGKQTKKMTRAERELAEAVAKKSKGA